MIKVLNIIFFIFLLFCISPQESPAGFAFSPAEFTGIPLSRFRMIELREERSLFKQIICAVTAALIAAGLLDILGNVPMILSGFHVVTQAR
jgi:hypothetical protein